MWSTLNFYQKLWRIDEWVYLGTRSYLSVGAEWGSSAQSIRISVRDRFCLAGAVRKLNCVWVITAFWFRDRWFCSLWACLEGFHKWNRMWQKCHRKNACSFEDAWSQFASLLLLVIAYLLIDCLWPKIQFLYPFRLPYDLAHSPFLNSPNSTSSSGTLSGSHWPRFTHTRHTCFCEY